jgi:hypothetical protein
MAARIGLTARHATPPRTLVAGLVAVALVPPAGCGDAAPEAPPGAAGSAPAATTPAQGAPR